MQEKIEKLIELTNCDEFKQLENYYQQPSMLKICKKHRSETAHSEFWAWLLDPKSNHGLGTKPLQLFAETCIKDYNNQYSFEDVIISTEESIGSAGRLDILIKSDTENFLIAIENKVNSSEKIKQTEKYYNALENHVQKNKYYVYMKPYEEYISENISCIEFVKVSYQNLYERVLIPLFEFNSTLYNQYCGDYINSLSTTDEESNHLILSKLENELYSSIVLNYTDTIITAIELLSSKSDIKTSEKDYNYNNLNKLFSFIEFTKCNRFEGYRDKINNVLQDTRDFTKYYVFFDNEIIDKNKKSISKNQILPTVFNDRKKYKNMSLNEFSSLFPIHLNTEFVEFQAYKSFDTKADARNDNPYSEKTRKNPFYDFENIIELKDKVVVLKKAWTARQRPEFNGQSSLGLLLSFFDKNKETFGVTITPAEK